MLTVKLVEKENASPEVKAIYEELEKMFGMVTPPFKAMANKPDYLKASVEKFKVVMHGGKIDQKTKLMVYLAVSIMNNCEICIDAFTKMLKDKMGVTDEELIEFYGVIDVATALNKFNTGIMLKPQA